MLSAETGDDVYGEDPTVNALEQECASMTAKQAGLFVTSGTQGNLLALLSHCQRGDEYIAGQEAHTYQLEAGGGAVLGGIQPQPIPFNVRGELELQQIEAVIKPPDIHYPRTRLLCLENTHNGKVLSLDYLAAFADFADRKKLATHLDGARVFNAATHLSVEVAQIAQHFDSVSMCLSKGLGTPMGSVLVGDRETISSARRWRKMLGGGMRQAGILAAAGIYALKHHQEGLEKDHQHAARLAAALSQIEGLGYCARDALEDTQEENTKATTKDTQEDSLEDSLEDSIEGQAGTLSLATNMIFLKMPPDRFEQLSRWLEKHAIKVSGQRWVTHRDISTEDINRVIEVCRAFPGADG